MYITVGYLCRSPPPACQYTGAVPPPPTQREGEDLQSMMAARPVLDTLYLHCTLLTFASMLLTFAQYAANLRLVCC